MEPSTTLIPDLSAQPPAADFIDNHADQYHPAFAVPPSEYDPASGLFLITSQPPNWGPPPSWEMIASTRAPAFPNAGRKPALPRDDPPPPRPLAEPVEALKFWDTLFPIAMDQFKKERPLEPETLVKLDLRIRDENNWTSVFDKLERAKQDYSNVDKGFKAKFRSVYRTIADNAMQPLMNVTRLVPDVEYVTPVLGIVEILLEAATTAARVRQQVLSGFDDIDMMFSQVELFLQIYRGDENIRRASVNLISATFHAIESAMKFFLRSTWKKGFSATFKGEDYQQDVTESLSNVKSLSATLINEAENSHQYEMSSSMKEILRSESPIASHLYAYVAHPFLQPSVTREWQTVCNQLRRMPHDLRNGFMVLLSELQRNRRENLSLSLAVQDIREALSRAPSPVPAGALPSASTTVPSQTLLDWIDIPDLAAHDMEYIAERRNVRVPPHEQARAEQIVRTQQFRDWLASPSSTQLLIHGNYDSQRYISGLSLFCQTLAQSLAQTTPYFLHLIFHCGLHLDDGDYAGGRVMIQSFICQLLCQYDFDGSLNSSEVVQQLVELGDMEELCELFETLVHRLPREVVLLCLIDGIVYYEREEFEHDVGLVLVTLLRLSGEQNTHAAVKILITSPTKTVDVRQPFPDELVLSMETLAGSEMVASRERLVRELSE
ncbi:hypothetical protein OQA88_2382 [Cercophora sp. LCS_1]